MKRFLALLTALLLLATVGCQTVIEEDDGEVTTTTTTAATTYQNPDVGNESDANSQPSVLPARIYALQTDDPMLRATVTLAPYNNRFSIVLPKQQSCQPYGTYRVNGDQLILTADDSGGDTYVFRMTDDSLVFLASESTPFSAVNEIADGAVFN